MTDPELLSTYSTIKVGGDAQTYQNKPEVEVRGTQVKWPPAFLVNLLLWPSFASLLTSLRDNLESPLCLSEGHLRQWYAVTLCFMESAFVAKMTRS